MKLSEWLHTQSVFYNPRDLRYLIQQVTERPLYESTVHDRVLTDEERSRLDSITEAYRADTPLAYALGVDEFFGLEFEVNESCLVPRKETEHIVEKALELIAAFPVRRVLDLGCGSGVIAICIQKASRRRLEVVASDIRMDTIRLARANARRHGARISFVQGDWLSAFCAGSFDLIVSNPPYVEDSAITGGLCREPRIALAGGDDGLRCIRTLLTQVPCILSANGYIVMEMGAHQKEQLGEFIREQHSFEVDAWLKDYAGLWRGVVLKKRPL